MSIKLQRFDFGSLRDFRGPIVQQVAADIAVVEEAPPPPPVFSEEDLASARMAAKKQGYTEGFEAGQQQAKKEADGKTQAANETVDRLSKTIGTMVADYQQLLTRESAELSELVLMIAKKVAGEALDQRGVETINALVERCMPVVFSKPKLSIDLHPDALEGALARIEPLLREQGYEGNVQFRANPSLELHDVVVDWGSGQAARSTAAVWQEIEALLERVPLELTFADTLKQTTPHQGE